jgi:hypothetical protein
MAFLDVLVRCVQTSKTVDQAWTGLWYDLLNPQPNPVKDQLTDVRIHHFRF